MEAERLLSIIGDIYDAALMPSQWQSVLARIVDFVDGHSAGIGSVNMMDQGASSHHIYGCDPYYLQLQCDEYIRYDPLMMLFCFPVGRVVTIADVMPYEDYLQTRFYLEWARPQGYVDSVSAVLKKSATSFGFFSIIRNERQGRVDETARRRMELLVPHLRRAALIGDVIDLGRDEATMLAATLDGIDAAIVLVDEQARIVHSNTSGRAMLIEATGPVMQKGGRVCVNDPEIDKSLRALLARAGSGDAAVDIEGIAMPLSAGGVAFVAHVLPLTSGLRRRTAAAYSAVAILFIRRISTQTTSAPEMIARRYKLTPTELRVLFAIVEVGGVPEVSQALGMGLGTVKTHLHRLFMKTGTTRQAELVKLVASLASPLLG